MEEIAREKENTPVEIHGSFGVLFSSMQLGCAGFGPELRTGNYQVQ